MANFLRQPGDEGIIRSGNATAPCAPASARWILAATILGSSMVFIDGTVVNVALSALQSDLNANVIDVQWVVESYALLLTAFLLLGGSLGDHYGRRRIFLLGVILFALASVWCSLASSIGQLVVARAFQGLGGALLVPGSLAIISNSFREEERGKAIGTWSGFTAITAAIGPVIGGWLIEHYSWRAVFFINVPLALFVILISWRHVPESRDSTARGGLDGWGATLITVALGSFVYGLIESSRLGFRHPAVFTTLIGGSFLLLVFFVFEGRTRKPMVPLALFRSRNFSGANLLTLFLYGALAGTLFFFPLNLIQVQGYTATAAGAALLPLILTIFLLSRWAGGLVHRFGAKLPLVIGPMIAGIGFSLFVIPGVGGSYWKTFFPAVMVLGLGMATSVAPLTTTVMNAVSGERAGIASGINNAVSRAAGLLAIAALGIVMLHTFNHSLDRRLSEIGPSAEVLRSLDGQRASMAAAKLPKEIEPATSAVLRQAINESFVHAFRQVMLIGAALAFASALSAWILIDGKQRNIVALPAKIGHGSEKK
jgi:EmrB/QacA subfamily drug resistance transporter